MRNIFHKLMMSRVFRVGETSQLDLKAISLYHAAKAQVAGDCVSDPTWTDLEMDDVFFRINRTCSTPGAQYLYHEMHLYRKDTTFLREKYRTYQQFLNKKESAQAFAKILQRLGGRNAAYIASVVFESTPERPVHFPLIILMSFLFVVSVAGLILISKEFILAVLAFGLLNTVVQQMMALRISNHVPDIGSLGRMLGVASALADRNETGFTEIDLLKRYGKFIRHLRRKFGWFLVDPHRLDELSASVIAYVNHLLLVNLILFYSAVEYVEKHRKELIEIFEAIGSLDSSIAIASYISSEKCCCPELTVEDRIEVDSLYHPVLEYPVANSFSLSSHSALITGSNMAGKTTFLKTIGINLILARTLGFCHGESAVFPSSSVLSSIRRQNSLQSQKSNYYTEIERILEFIRATGKGERYLFLIDEIFSGTNTVERLASASAVLKYLVNKSIVLVTTHDIELEHMLDEKYKMFHFRDKIEEGRHFFDYRIKPGPSRSQNAIHLLKITGYPPEIIAEALSTSEMLSGMNPSL